MGNDTRRLRIGMVSGPMVPIPPSGYAGTERIVAVLVDNLVSASEVGTSVGVELPDPASLAN